MLCDSCIYQSRLNVVWGPGPDRLMGAPMGKVSGVGTTVLCTSKSGNAQLGPIKVRRQIAKCRQMGFKLLKSMETGET